MKYLLPAALLCFVFLACKKNSTKEPTNTELLTGKSWKYASGGVDYNKDGTIDLNFSTLAVIPACLLDNTATFNASGSGTADEGATKCDASAPQTEPFTWSFANNGQSINIGGNGLLGTGGQFKIITLNSTSFSLSKDTTVSLSGIPPTPVSIIVNLQH